MIDAILNILVLGAWMGMPKNHKQFNWQGDKVASESWGSDSLV